MKDWGGFAVGVVGEVGEIEGGAARRSTYTGYELADLHLKLDSVDVDYIIRRGMASIRAWVESKLHMKTVGATLDGLHPSYQTRGEQQARIVDAHLSIFKDEVMLVEAGKLVGLGMPVAVSFLGEASLQYGAEERRGVLHSLEEGPLPQLGLRLEVFERLCPVAAVVFAETFVIDAVVNGADLFDK